MVNHCTGNVWRLGKLGRCFLFVLWDFLGEEASLMTRVIMAFHFATLCTAESEGEKMIHVVCCLPIPVLSGFNRIAPRHIFWVADSPYFTVTGDQMGPESW